LSAAFEALITARAETALAEIRAMAEFARRSTGQRFRQLRKEIRADFKRQREKQ